MWHFSLLKINCWSHLCKKDKVHSCYYWQIYCYVMFVSDYRSSNNCLTSFCAIHLSHRFINFKKQFCESLFSIPITALLSSMSDLIFELFSFFWLQETNKSYKDQGQDNNLLAPSWFEEREHWIMRSFLIFALRSLRSTLK